MVDLSAVGLTSVGKTHHNLATSELCEEAIKRNEGHPGQRQTGLSGVAYSGWEAMNRRSALSAVALTLDWVNPVHPVTMPDVPSAMRVHRQRSKVSTWRSCHVPHPNTRALGVTWTTWPAV